jgi:hypothetical protein
MCKRNNYKVTSSLTIDAWLRFEMNCKFLICRQTIFQVRNIESWARECEVSAFGYFNSFADLVLNK